MNLTIHFVLLTLLMHSTYSHYACTATADYVEEFDQCNVALNLCQSEVSMCLKLGRIKPKCVIDSKVKYQKIVDRVSKLCACDGVEMCGSSFGLKLSRGVILLVLVSLLWQ